MDVIGLGVGAGLVDRAMQRDAEAFGTLVRPRLEPMLRTATAILGDESEARDALQEALASAWQELPNLRDPARFQAWLARILLNTCRLALKRRTRKRVREIQLDSPSFSPPGSQLASGTRLADEVGSRIALDRAFERLGPDERTILVLHHLDERPLREIALLLAIPEGTVKSRLHTARQALERALERERR